ncbi:unnamed protein product, partial [Medioppia subpectinata]
MSGKPLDGTNRGVSCEEEIEERLRRLKEDTTAADDDSQRPVTDQKAIEERLARLKGMDPRLYSMPPITVFQPTRHKTDTQKADDLLKQFVDELKIDD